MLLNIKNRETYGLLKELGQLTGETMEEIIAQSVRERIERMRQQSRVSVADQLLRIGKDCAARLQKPFRLLDDADLLYNDQGLPR